MSFTDDVLNQEAIDYINKKCEGIMNDKELAIALVEITNYKSTPETKEKCVKGFVEAMTLSPEIRPYVEMMLDTAKKMIAEKDTVSIISLQTEYLALMSGYHEVYMKARFERIERHLEIV
jgi:hypothetical protein